MRSSSFSLREFLSVCNNEKLLQNTKALHRANNMKDVEVKSFKCLAQLILKTFDNNQDVEGIFFNTNINVVPDFDVLIFSEKCCIDIELKSVDNSSTKENARKTLMCQKRILDILGKNTYCYAFFEDTNTLLKYEGCSLEKANIKDLSELLLQQKTLNNNPVQAMEPKDYLMSPLDDIERFMEGKYYLEMDQRRIKEKILSPGLHGVYGEAGTGKTLLALDIARQESALDHTTLFVFPGNIREGHELIAKKLKGLKILPAKKFLEEDLDQYDQVIVDESQRLRMNQRSKLYRWGKENHDKKRVILFYHVQQTLSPKESGLATYNMCKTFEKDGIGDNNRLSKKIRTRPEITAFTNYLFQLKCKPPRDIELYDIMNHVTVKYFKNADNSKPWIQKLQDNGYKFVVPTGNNCAEASSDQYSDMISANTHEIIGSEVSKVVTYIDSSVCYNEKGELKNNYNSEYYLIKNELYVNLTRAEDKLAIAIIGNEDVYNAITEKILNPKEWHID